MMAIHFTATRLVYDSGIACRPDIYILYMYMIIYVYYIYMYKYSHSCNPLHIYIYHKFMEQFHSAAQAGPLSLKTRVEYSSMPKNAMQAVMGRRGLRKSFRHGRTNLGLSENRVYSQL